MSCASLDRVGPQSHVMLVGHGRASSFESYCPESLAQRLHDSGLRQAGAIEFKACNIGSGQFLERFGKALGTRQIQVAYLLGYTGLLLAPVLPFQAGKYMGSAGLRRAVVANALETIALSERAGLRVVKGLPNS